MAKKILVVDDEPDILMLTTFRLKRMGFEVLNASGGEEALEKSRLDRPDIIFLDLLMPGIGGLETCRRLKQDEALCSIPVVIVSASGDQKMMQEAIQLGAVAYIVKPFDPAELLNQLKQYLS